MDKDALPPQLTEEEWLEKRKQGIGGTDISAIVGINPYKTAFDVYAEKLGLVEEKPSSRLARRGRKLESLVVDEYEEETGNHALRIGRRLFTHPDYPWWVGSPDDLVQEGRGLEAKTVWSSQVMRQFGQPGTDAVPDLYFVQVMWYMPLTRQEVFDIAAMLGPRFQVHPVEINRDLLLALREQAERFMQDYLLPQRPPPLDYSEGAREYLRKMFPAHEEPLRVATPEEEALMAAYFQMAAQAEKFDRVADGLANQIKAAIGKAEGVEGQPGRITWRKSKDREEVDWEKAYAALRTQLPKTHQQLADRLAKAHQHTIIGPRRFNARPGKDE